MNLQNNIDSAAEVIRLRKAIAELAAEERDTADDEFCPAYQRDLRRAFAKDLYRILEGENIMTTNIDAQIARQWVESETTQDHPTELTTLEDYRNAPEGTVVVDSDGTRWTKWDDVGNWIIVGANESKTSRAMSRCARRVLRWGWEA